MITLSGLTKRYGEKAAVRARSSRAGMLSWAGARDRAQLVVLAYESGMIKPGWLG